MARSTLLPLFWKPELNDPKERWLTRSEAARLLWAARRYQHLAAPDPARALHWLAAGRAAGAALGSDRLRRGAHVAPAEGKAEDKKKKTPKVKLGWRIMAHLKRWKRLDGDQKLVCYFTGPNHPGARQVGDPHGAWKKVIKAAELAGTGVTRHTLRHTRATWMMQKGVPIWEAPRASWE